MKESNKQRTERLKKQEVKPYLDRLIHDVPWSTPGIYLPLIGWFLFMVLYFI